MGVLFKTVLRPLAFILLLCVGISAAGVLERTPRAPQPLTQMIPVKLIVNKQSFNLLLYDVEAARTFARQLPLNIQMKDLHHNEKYHYLAQPLPTNPTQPRRMRAGDVMLFGNDCLVLFYQDFLSAYSYTPLGYVQDISQLPAALGHGNVEVHFE